jgi:hypothetical protein
MQAIQVIDSTYLVTLPSGRAVMVGAPPEALKILVLWEFPSPSVVVLPPDPLFANGLNQASFEFLLFNHMFLEGGLEGAEPFFVVCDPEQRPRVESLIHEMLRGPSDDAMAGWRTPAAHRKQLLSETAAVSGEVAQRPLCQMARVIAFEEGIARLPDGTFIERGEGEVCIHSEGKEARVPRRAQSRTQLPFYFADVEKPAEGPRFGVQVIGSASGFSGAEWGSCFVIWINGQPLIIDGTPYLDDHLRRLGIEDDHILGYLITHNHEDHANAIGQLVSRRPVTVLTSGPVMAGLVTRLGAILSCTEQEVRKLFRWVPLHPGFEGFGEPLHWFGAEIRTWYSVHTVPTLGVDIKLAGKRIRLPGDTLWGRQLRPLVESGVMTPARAEFVQNSYHGADVIIADAGGGPVHPDPQEVAALLERAVDSRLMVTHIPESARDLLPTAEPGTTVTLVPRETRTPEEAMALFGSPALRNVPERWLLGLLHGGEVRLPEEGSLGSPKGALFLLAGNLVVHGEDGRELALQRGDLFHPDLLPGWSVKDVVSTARWTRLLEIPETLHQAFLKDTGIEAGLQRLYRTRTWWQLVTDEELGLDTLVELSHLCRERSFRPGAEIVRQGERASHFFIVTLGEVEVSRLNGGGQRRIGRFGAGYHFGEIALLGQEVRTATVRALEAVQVLELPGRAFLRHLMEIPLARYRVGRLAAQRRAELLDPHGPLRS